MSDSFRATGGFADLVGYDLTRWQDDLAEVSLTVGPQHINRSGVMHGGMLATLIDTACGYAGCYSPEGAAPRRAWLYARHPQLEGARAIDLIHEDRSEEVLNILDRLDADVYL